MLSSSLFPTSFTLRPDVVRRVHSLISRNRQQPHGVAFSYHPSGKKAGHNNVAHSWGTGRAKARVPRVSGSGSSRCGQASVANFARKGHMFSPIVPWRRLHRIVPIKERNLAILSCLYSSQISALVLARGHLLPENISLPLKTSQENIAPLLGNTKAIKNMLIEMGLKDELKRCKNGKKLNKGRSNTTRFKN